MTAISDDHVEWAVVNRLRQMVEASPHPEFNVTCTYALFTSILCWTLQRVRSKGSAEGDQLAASVLRKLEQQKVEEAPWKISTSSSDIVPMSGSTDASVGPFREFAGRSAAQFLIDLRNAVAHGDARNVKPFHKAWCQGEQLAGFSFNCQETKNNGREIVWSGTIVLLESDMRRIGIALADAFWKALRRSEGYRRDGHFERDAALIEEAA